MAITVSAQRFEELVNDGLDQIPDDLWRAMNNVVVLIEDRNDEEPNILGLYEGVALTERDTTYSGFLPDRIFIYREALCDMCDSEEQLAHEVMVTVIHEVAHHFGIDDATLHARGWA